MQKVAFSPFRRFDVITPRAPGGKMATSFTFSPPRLTFAGWKIVTILIERGPLVLLVCGPTITNPKILYNRIVKASIGHEAKKKGRPKPPLVFIDASERRSRFGIGTPALVGLIGFGIYDATVERNLLADPFPFGVREYARIVRGLRVFTLRRLL